MAHFDITRSTGADNKAVVDRIDSIGVGAVFAGLAVVFLWFGGMKFTAYEAEAIAGLVQNSPLLAWVYEIVSVRNFGTILGTIEVAIGLLIAARVVSPAASAIGGALAAVTFVVTTSFLLTTPGVVEPSLGFPGLSVMPGQFLLKDVALLAASIFVAGHSLKALVDHG